MKYFLIFLLLFGCGTINHEGNVGVNGTIKIDFNLDEIKGYFLAECTANQDPNPTACANAKVGGFLDFLNSQVAAQVPASSL